MSVIDVAKEVLPVISVKQRRIILVELIHEVTALDTIKRKQ